MKKRGFTLIELLAVIVILAIIALIATPAVLNIIEDSRKGAAEASARNIMSTAETYYMSKLAKRESVGTIDLSGSTLKYSGDQASKGYVTFDNNGNASGKMYIGGYCVTLNSDSSVASEKSSEEDCEIEMPVGPQKLVFPVADGQEVYFNPVSGLACSKNQVETNVNNYKAENSDSITGLKEGCMKWYAFLDSEESSTVNLILDHNTTGRVAWANSGETTPTVVNAKLQADITNWNDTVKSTARLISASELNQIAPTNPNWNVSDYNTWYYLHNGNQTEYEGAAGSNTYAWLFDNTNGCETYGCNTNDSGTYGYWTSSFASSGYAWRVDRDGRLNCDVVTFGGLGVRPVITVSKSIFY